MKYVRFDHRILVSIFWLVLRFRVHRADGYPFVVGPSRAVLGGAIVPHAVTHVSSAVDLGVQMACIVELVERVDVSDQSNLAM